MAPVVLVADRGPQRGELWRHVKTGNVYRILHLGLDEPTQELVVIYQNATYPEAPVWVRRLDVFVEMVDGRSRFERVE